MSVLPKGRSFTAEGSAGGSPDDVSEVPVTEGLANVALLILQCFRRRFTCVTSTSSTSSGEPPMEGRSSTAN